MINLLSKNGCIIYQGDNGLFKVDDTLKIKKFSEFFKEFESMLPLHSFCTVKASFRRFFKISFANRVVEICKRLQSLEFIEEKFLHVEHFSWISEVGNAINFETCKRLYQIIKFLQDLMGCITKAYKDYSLYHSIERDVNSVMIDCHILVEYFTLLLELFSGFYFWDKEEHEHKLQRKVDLIIMDLYLK